MAVNISPSNMAKIGVGVAIVIGILIINPVKVVGAGERGVIFSRISGVNLNPLGEGINFVVPFVDTVEIYDIKTQKFVMNSACSTSDLQDIQVKLAINYRLDDKKVSALHQEIGPLFEDKLIFPFAEESIKSATALFKIEEVITRRQELRDTTIKILKVKLQEYHIILQDVSIMDISFSEKYSASVEEKQIQEQRIKTKSYERQQAEEEAKRKITLAKAEAISQKLLSRAATHGSISLEWIKKWDGKLPTYMGEGKFLVPFKK